MSVRCAGPRRCAGSGAARGCGEWNTLGPAPVRVTRPGGGARAAPPRPPWRCATSRATRPAPCRPASASSTACWAAASSAGSVTLVFGPPGIGKSTLLFQVLASVAATGVDVMLASAEESLTQVSGRASRIGPVPRHLLALEGPDVEAIEAAVERHRPAIVVVDSLQSVSDPELAQPAGSLAQVRACVERLTRLAKSSGVPLLLVGHVTKDGDLAGPRAVEHLVDTVLSFDGDRHHALRVLTSVKHRFGPTGEVGIFEMRDDGLRAVPDPGPLMLGDRMAGVPGSVVVPVLQGRRPLLVEVQALLGPGTGGAAGAAARPHTLGIDAARAEPPPRRPGLPHRGRRAGAGRVLRRRRRRHHRHRAGGRPGRSRCAMASVVRRRPGAAGAGRVRRARPGRARCARSPARTAAWPRRTVPGSRGRWCPPRRWAMPPPRPRRPGMEVHGVRTLAEALAVAASEAGAQTRAGYDARVVDGAGGSQPLNDALAMIAPGIDAAGGPRPDPAGQARGADHRGRRPGRPLGVHRRVPPRRGVHAAAPLRAGQDGRRHHPGRRRLPHRPGQRAPGPQGHHPDLGDRHPPPHGRAGGPLHRRAGDRRLRGHGDHRRLPQRPQAHHAVGGLAHRPLEPGAVHAAAVPRPLRRRARPR